MKIGLTLVFAFVLALMVGAASASPPDDLDPAVRESLAAWERDYQQTLKHRVEQLVVRDDSRSLLAAAELTVEVPLGVMPVDAEQRARDQAAADALLARSIASEPVELLALWRAASRCQVTDVACDRTALWQRLAERDPDNAMVWLTLAADARRRGDVAQADRLLLKASSMPRNDAYDVRFGRLLLDAHDGFLLPKITPDVASALASVLGSGQNAAGELPFDIINLLMIGRWSAHAFPALSDISVFCSMQQAEELAATRRDACRASLETMTGTATTVLVRKAALSFMARLTQDQPDGDRWLEALRQAEWRIEHYYSLSSANPSGELAPGHFRRVLRDGELAALDHALGVAGMDVAPAPDDWISPSVAALELLDGKAAR